MLNHDTNNHNSHDCAYADQLVSYLYDEATVSEKAQFVNHLEKCASCSEEFAAFGFVRSSIREWRNEEIFSLEMPALEIPILKTETAAQKTEGAAESNSWLDNLRRIFALSPKLAFGTAAFAVLAVCVGLALVIINFSGNETIATIPHPDKLMASNSSDSKTEEKISTPKNDEILPTENPNPQKLEIADKKSNDKASPVKKDSQIKAEKSAPKNRLIAPKSNNTLAVDKNKKGARAQEAPKLSNFDEDEDESLRLADLFSEADTK